MWSVVRDRLTEANPEMTLWESESEYRFSGLLMRLAGLLMPDAFRRQPQQHMQDFKAFAEQGKEVRDGKNRCRSRSWPAGATSSRAAHPLLCGRVRTAAQTTSNDTDRCHAALRRASRTPSTPWPGSCSAPGPLPTGQLAELARDTASSRPRW